jgi:hypothetical protein
VMATVFHRGDGGEPRPGAGVAYEVSDPSRGPIGLRLTINYRPEGLVEPEGEVELAATATRNVGAGRLTASLTYGRDSEGNERDGETLAAYSHAVDDFVAAGVTARGRVSLGTEIDGDREWDVIAGGFAAVQARRATFHLLGGIERAGLVMEGATSGAIVLVGAAAVW